MKYFKVGQTVYFLADSALQNGTVTSINDGVEYPIRIDLGNGDYATFTDDGRLFVGCGIRLFQTKPIITPNVPIFEERPAYFYHDGSRVWFYDILIKIDELGSGNAKVDGYWYPKWQYEAPTL